VRNRGRFRTLFLEPVTEDARERLGPCRSRDFATATRHAASFHPARSPAMGLRSSLRALGPKVFSHDVVHRFLQLRCDAWAPPTNASIPRAWFWTKPVHVCHERTGCPGLFVTASSAVACAISVSRFRAALERLRVNEDAAPADRHRVEDFALLQAREPLLSDARALRGHRFVPARVGDARHIRNDRGSDDGTCPAKGTCRTTPRSGVALLTAACEENRSAFPREGFPR